MILCGNSFTSKGLNSLLSHFETNLIWIDRDRLGDFRSEDLDWNVRCKCLFQQTEHWPIGAGNTGRDIANDQQYPLLCYITFSFSSYSNY